MHRALKGVEALPAEQAVRLLPAAEERGGGAEA
jgi:hypothetical protein